MKKKTYPIHPDDYGCLYYDEEGNFNPPWKQYDYISLKHFKRGFGPEPSFWPHPLEKASHINFKKFFEVVRRKKSEKKNQQYDSWKRIERVICWRDGVSVNRDSINLFVKQIITNKKIKISKKIDDLLGRIPFSDYDEYEGSGINRQALASISCELAFRNLLSIEMEGEIWSSYYLQELDHNKNLKLEDWSILRDKETGKSFFDEDEEFEIHVIFERLLFRHAIDLMNPTIDEEKKTIFFRKPSSKEIKYIKDRKPLREAVNKLINKSKKNITYRTEMLLTYPEKFNEKTLHLFSSNCFKI